MATRQYINVPTIGLVPADIVRSGPTTGETGRPEPDGSQGIWYADDTGIMWVDIDSEWVAFPNSLVFPATPVQLVNGNNDSVETFGSHIRIVGPTAAFTIRSIKAVQDGQVLVIINTTTEQMTLTANWAGASLGEAINVPGGSDLVLTAGQGSSATLLYTLTGTDFVVTACMGI